MGLPYVDIDATGNRINELRRLKGMSVADVQNVFGFSTPQAVYKWITGKCLPTVDNLVVLAAVFGTTLDDIIVTKVA